MSLMGTIRVGTTPGVRQSKPPVWVSNHPEDIAFRCNLSPLAGNNGQEIMVDFAADHITSEEAAELIKVINAELGGNEMEFYPGVSYRHLMVWHGGKEKMRTTPPHDITGQPTAGCFPEGEGAEQLQRLMTLSREILRRTRSTGANTATNRPRQSGWGQV
jgi:2,3-bisphosphoglycerate-independent phosphoglycerate mutase